MGGNALPVLPMLRPHKDGDRSAIYHGGNLSAARHEFPLAPLPWLDLSTGINAIPYPLAPISPESWTRLPDALGLKHLEGAAANAYGVPWPRQVIAAAGTQILIQWLPRLFPARHVAVLGFGYQEHPAVWRANGAIVRVVENLESLSSPSTDVAIVVNPNNPDGRTIEPQALSDLAIALNRRRKLLIVDEAFMDVVHPSKSLIPSMPEDGVIVLRSFGKAYGLAGLRLGFAITGPRLAERLRKAVGPWAVSGPAITIGAEALADKSWLEETTARLTADAKRMDALLRAAGFSVLGGTPLFRLAANLDCARWFEKLGQKGILVRPFPDRPNWLRFGLPGPENDWARLDAALQ